MIDQATVQKILSAADIVDVVSDFVTLKRRGANFVGLCPFHNDRNPSFYVSRAKGYCKCFSCGKGGSAVGFIMEHQQMTYVEALRYLAAKYHIEIEEREMTDEERQRQSAREAMLMVNEWACDYFEHQLHDTQAGRDIGMAYFRERGFGDAIIKRFRLGYSSETRGALYDAAIKAGFNRQLLFDVGLCIDDERGGGYDRFRGRVIFPIFNVAGKVVGFGGRTLRGDKAKYVNSPESIVYNKRNELYGLFQAKREMTKQDKCFIVEGYADVISMHQAGFENVIASSGTALTEGHIHQIHRFTENITELFDGDAAGVHAAMRGVDMLLEQDMNIKILVLPDDDDPDSFSRKHTGDEVRRFIDENETDFIRFKTSVLLQDTDGDPVKRSRAITEVVKSIAVIPQAIKRSVYAKECAAMFEVDEQMILREIQKYVLAKRDADWKRREREKAVADATMPPASGGAAPSVSEGGAPSPPASATSATEATAPSLPTSTADAVERCERDAIRLVAKYGMCYMCETTYDDGVTSPTTVVEYVYNNTIFNELLPGIVFTTPVYKRIFDVAMEHVDGFYAELEQYTATLRAEGDVEVSRQLAALDVTGHTPASIEDEEKKIRSAVAKQIEDRVGEYRANYLERILCSSPDDEVRNVAYNLVTDRYRLSKIHSLWGSVATGVDRLQSLVDSAINVWVLALLMARAREIERRIDKVDYEQGVALMKELANVKIIIQKLSKQNGERVVVPR